MGRFKVWSRPTWGNLPRYRRQRPGRRQPERIRLGCEPVEFSKRLRRWSVQTQLTYGEGLFRYFNDDFQNNDAAFDSSGNLTAIPACGAMIGYSHKWTDYLRSTVTYGYVHLDNEFSQEPDAYHHTHYASLNLVWKARKRLSLGWRDCTAIKRKKMAPTGTLFAFSSAFCIPYLTKTRA